MSDTTLTVEALAKVNLTLHVVGRRPDGYHLLDSLVAFAGVGDTIRVAPADTLELVVDGPTAAALPEGENIVVRTAQLLAAAAGRPATAAIHLTKRLPVAAGIGGGSADAAATLTALARLWQVEMEPRRWHALALSIGADVPVCLISRATRMQGVGEILTPAPTLPPAWLVLVNPLEPLSTPSVFKARTGAFSDPAPLATAPTDAQALAQALAARRNDLTAAAIALLPVIGDMLATLTACQGCLLARMSGSGATCFGLFSEESEARAAAANIKRGHPGWWVAPAPLLA